MPLLVLKMRRSYYNITFCSSWEQYLGADRLTCEGVGVKEDCSDMQKTNDVAETVPKIIT